MSLWITARLRAVSKTCSIELGKLERHSEVCFDNSDKEIKALVDAKRSAFRYDCKNKHKRSQYQNVRSKGQNEVRKLNNN